MNDTAAGDLDLARLLGAVAAGDRGALRRVYEAQQKRLFGLANAILREAAEAHGFLWIDPSGWFTSPSAARLVGPDTIHATDEGHRYLAMRMAKALENLDLA